MDEPDATKRSGNTQDKKLYSDQAGLRCDSKVGSYKTHRLEDFAEVQTWLRTVSTKTAKSYLATLRKFCSWCNKTPHQLIIERDAERNISDPNKRTGTKNLILDFRIYLENQKYSPKSINSMDGAVRSFFSAVLGKEGMINVGNYANRDVSTRKDLIPTLEELKKMTDVSDLSTKFSILFLAQTGMRPEDALKRTVGDVQRELDLGRCPLAISFLPEKDRNKGIGERITFLGKDGVEILRQSLEWRKRSGETITADSRLLTGRTKKFKDSPIRALTKQNLNIRIQEAAKKAGVQNGDSNGKYGRMREYCLRKFFITQLTNHGVEDKIVNFFSCHKVSQVDLVYWSRRVEELREIYRQREKYLNPISGTQSRPSPEEIERKIEAKLKEFMQSQQLKETVLKFLGENGNEIYKSVVVKTEKELIHLSNKGYDCQNIGHNKWLMKRKVLLNQAPKT